MLSILRPTFARAFSASAFCSATTSNQVLAQAMNTVQNIAGGQPIIQDLRASTPLQPAPRATSEPVDLSKMVIPPAEDPLLTYVASRIMRHGKRQQANRIVSQTLLHLHTLTRAPPLPIFRQAIFAAAPAVRAKSITVAVKTGIYPQALSERKRTWFAVEWLVSASNNQPGRTMGERLAREMIAAVNGSSKALNKKEEVHKLAMVNRYAHSLFFSLCLVLSVL